MFSSNQIDSWIMLCDVKQYLTISAFYHCRFISHYELNVTFVYTTTYILHRVDIHLYIYCRKACGEH